MQWPKHFAEELTCKVFGLDTFNRVHFACILYNRPGLVIRTIVKYAVDYVICGSDIWVAQSSGIMRFLSMGRRYVTTTVKGTMFHH
jgi:hypothetical protein